MATCKGCGAAIEWIKYNGKAHPIDAKPKRVFVSIECPESGEVLGWELVNGFESHFSTCPDAAKFRQKKELDRPDH